MYLVHFVSLVSCIFSHIFTFNSLVLSIDDLQVYLLYLLKEWSSLPKYMELSCLMGFFFVDVLKGYTVSVTKLAY